jgi:hypothetical protein
MAAQRIIPLAGRLDGCSGAFDVPELLLAISGTGKTGRLEVATPEAEKTVYLDAGSIVFAASSCPDERLGVYLLHRNELDLRSLRRLSPQVRPGLRLGALLVENGLLSPEALTSAVAGQVRAIVLDLFRWPVASYRFLENGSSRDEAITVALPLAKWILDGIESVESWSRVSRGLGSLDSRYVVVSGHEESFRKLDLDTGSLELLALLSHPKSIEEICGSSELPDIVVCRRLWAFRLLGWTRIESPQSADEPEASLDSDLEGLRMILNGEPLREADRDR